MKRNIFLYTVSLFITLSAIAVNAQNYYASWAPLSENAPIEVKTQMQSNYLKTPTQDEFELPAYPNALIISMNGVGETPSDSSALPLITLISIDPPVKIIAFYMDQIKNHNNWKWNKTFKMFYKGSPMKAINRQEPYIMIQSASPGEFDLVNISKTLREFVASKITVCFNPNTIK